MNAPTMSQPGQEIADEIVEGWCADGVFRLTGMEGALGPQMRRAFASSRRFFGQSAGRKSRCVSDLTYAGYVAPGEEAARVAEGEAEAGGREAFTVCQDVSPDDPRVRERWPCHGPVPWPDAEFRRAMLALTDELCALADRLLLQVALGLGLDDPNVFARLTWSGWHHLRTEHVPSRTAANVTGPDGIDDGLLVIAMRDDPDVLTVTPGAVLRFITGETLPLAPTSPTPQPQAREGYTMTYHHAPNFQSCVRPAASAFGEGCLHYGTYITNAFMRRYPERVTTLRILAEERLAVLAAGHPAAEQGPTARTVGPCLSTTCCYL
jgi:2-oxoglutarate dioxygenase / 2-oxoglutarate/L-arginine monooxygenase/decarboxylase